MCRRPVVVAQHWLCIEFQMEISMRSRLLKSSEKSPDWPRRIAVALSAVVVLIAGYALIYQWVMVNFEGRTVPYLQAVQVVIESLTTAGFGGHAPWESQVGNAFVILMNLSGVLLVFLAIPVFGMPLIREIFQRQAPRTSDLKNHIIVCGYSEKDEVVRQELEHYAQEKNVDIPFLYIEPDEELARELLSRGVSAMVGDPESVETLRAANAEYAEALVADVDDETNPSVVLAAKLIDEELPVLSVVRDRRVAAHHEYAGADRVIRARESFGKSLAIRASGSYAQKFRNAVCVKSGVEVTELVIEDGCDLVGQTLAEAALFNTEGRQANVIAAWVGGKFLISPAPSTPIRKNAILVVSGALGDTDISGIHVIPSSPERASRVVIGGFGTVGKTVWSALDEVGIDTTVIDRNIDKGEFGIEFDDEPQLDADIPNPIDTIGDVTDEATLREVDLENADAIVLSLDRDIPTIYASILVEHLAPDVEIIARADESESISTLYQAGADFVLSLTTVTGEILASELLDLLGEKGGFLPASTEFEFTRTEGSAFGGYQLLDIDLRNVTGCTVVAVERDERLLTDIRGDFQIDDDDDLIIAGSKRAIEKFETSFLPSWLEERRNNGDSFQDRDSSGDGGQDADDSGADEPDDAEEFTGSDGLDAETEAVADGDVDDELDESASDSDGAQELDESEK